MADALVVVNPRARRGASIREYASIRGEVEAGFRVRETILDSSGEWLDAVVRARRDGFERVIAVGGDGTVHAVANALLSNGVSDARYTTLGAVGLGSSNDFHKPVRGRARGIPIRIGPPAQRDVGLATWEDARGVAHARFFVVSASIGLTARANRRFSNDRGVARWLGARSVDAAIAYAAGVALVRQENVRARLRASMEEPARDVEVSSLGVMLTPYLAGSFHYGSAVQPGSGRFALHLCEGMGRLGLLRTMTELLQGRFGRSPGTASWSSRAISLELEHEDDLELDGELFRARTVHFETFPDALAVCA